MLESRQICVDLQREGKNCDPTALWEDLIRYINWIFLAVIGDIMYIISPILVILLPIRQNNVPKSSTRKAFHALGAFYGAGLKLIKE